MGKVRSVLALAPVQVAIDCTVLLLGATALVLLLSDPPWVALVPGGIAAVLSEGTDRLTDRPPEMSSLYRVTVRTIFFLLLVTLVAGLWVHAATEDWSTALHALGPTVLLAVLVLVHTPWAHWLDRLGGDGGKAEPSEP